MANDTETSSLAGELGYRYGRRQAIAMDEVKHDPKTGQFSAGETVKFNGRSADRTVEGSMPVRVINPHSNAHKITHTDKRGTAYEGAYRHLPTATVERISL